MNHKNPIFNRTKKLIEKFPPSIKDAYLSHQSLILLIILAWVREKRGDIKKLRHGDEELSAKLSSSGQTGYTPEHGALVVIPTNKPLSEIIIEQRGDRHRHSDQVSNNYLQIKIGL